MHPHHTTIVSVQRDVEAPVTVGTNYIYTVGNYQLIQPVSFYMRLTTDATVINRLVICYGSSAGATPFRTGSTAVQPASTTYEYFFSVGMPVINHLATIAEWYGPLPDQMFIPYAQVFRTLIENLQAGDQIMAANLVYKRWPLI